MVERLITKALLALAFCMVLILPVSTALAQDGVWEGTKKGVKKGIDKTEDVGEAVGKGVVKGGKTVIDKTEDVGEAVGKGAVKGGKIVIDKTEDVGEAVGKGAKDLFTDDDPDSDNDEFNAEGAQATEPQQRSKPSPVYSGTESSSETESARELPATAGEQPLLLLIGALSLVSAATLKLVRRLPNSQ